MNPVSRRVNIALILFGKWCICKWEFNNLTGELK